MTLFVIINYYKLYMNVNKDLYFMYGTMSMSFVTFKHNKCKMHLLRLKYLFNTLQKVIKE